MLKTIFLGSRPFVFPVIDTLFRHTTLIAALTKPDAHTGRGEKLTPSPVKEYIIKLNPEIPIFSPEKLDDNTYEQLQALQPDLLVVAAYGLLIPKRFLDLPTKMTINIHPSLLPHLRGASPVQSALLEGLTETGVTVMQLDEKLDHGPILQQEKLPISPTDTFETLGKKAFQKGADMLPQLLKRIEDNSITPTPQDETHVTFCKQITREDGFIDLKSPSEKTQIDQMIRAYYPWPGVWTNIEIKGKQMRLKLLPEKMVQLEGKNKMSIKDFLNGYPEVSEVLLTFFS